MICASLYARLGAAFSRPARSTSRATRKKSTISLVSAAYLLIFAPAAASAQSTEHWDVEFWGGHHGVSIANNPSDHASNSPTGTQGGGPSALWHGPDG